MSMLAEPRRKQRWSLNPRGKEWSDDQNKFGQRMLEKMGWSKGKGLGANGQGTTEAIRVKVKNDAGGIGFDKNQMDHAWTEHQDSFNTFLQQLQGSEESEVVQTAEKTDSLSGKSLELKSKQSRARVHYHKFTRGKDVNKYSTKDLANIFGQKDLNEKQMKKEIQKGSEIASESVGSRTYETGVITIYGGSMADYFKNKSSSYVGQSNKENVDEHNSSDDEGVQYRGFGFSQNQNAADNDISDSRTVKKEASNFAFDNPLLNTKCKLWNNIDNSSGKTTDNVLQFSKKRKNEFTSENTDSNLSSSEKTNVSKKLKMSAQQDCLNSGFVNSALDLESHVDETHNGREFEVARLRLNDTNEELNSVSDNRSGQSVTVSNSQDDCTVESSKKKKKKAKTKERCNGAFENSALDLQSKGSENHIGKEFEVPRVHLGITNEALDLTDESNKKKRVTFNDQVEYSTDCNKKKKLKAKLDKFEVGNEKIKKKRKREHDEVPNPLGIVNEALDIEILSEEINDNEVNERKSKKIKKRKERRMSNLETIEEAPEDDRQNPTEDPRQIDVITLDKNSTNVADDVANSAASLPEKKMKIKKEKTKENITVIDITGDEEEAMKHSKKKKKHDKKPANEDTGTDVSKSLEISDVKKEENTESKMSKKNRKRKHLEEKTDASKMNAIDKEIKLKKKSKEAKSTDIEVITDMAENKDLSDKNDIKDEPDITPNTLKKNKKRSKSKAEITKENSSAETESSIKGEYTSTPLKNEHVEDTSLTKNSGGNSQSDSLTINSSWNGRIRMPKKMLKTLFHRKSILQFPGSNIHEIKGYGADIEGTEVPCT